MFRIRQRSNTPYWGSSLSGQSLPSTASASGSSRVDVCKTPATCRLRPRASRAGFYKRACHVFAFLFVGPVKVIGRENAKFDGRGLILPNHQFAMDFAVVGRAVPFSYRQLAKAKESGRSPARHAGCLDRHGRRPGRGWQSPGMAPPTP